jgi:hypothetical protein
MRDITHAQIIGCIALVFVSVTLCLLFILGHDYDLHKQINSQSNTVDSLEREVAIRDAQLLLYTNKK